MRDYEILKKLYVNNTEIDNSVFETNIIREECGIYLEEINFVSFGDYKIYVNKNGDLQIDQMKNEKMVKVKIYKK